MQKGLDVSAVTLVIALAKPLLQYRISSCDSAKPHPVSQKDVQGQWTGLTYTKYF